MYLTTWDTNFHRLITKCSGAFWLQIDGRFARSESTQARLLGRETRGLPCPGGNPPLGSKSMFGANPLLSRPALCVQYGRYPSMFTCVCVCVRVFVCVRLHIHRYVQKHRHTYNDNMYNVIHHIIHSSSCACHPCAGAMLIFCVSFQVWRMIPEGNPNVIRHTSFMDRQSDSAASSPDEARPPTDIMALDTIGRIWEATQNAIGHRRP